MANTFVSLRRLQRFYNGIKNKFALKSEVPSKTSDLTNDSNFITSSDIPETESYSISMTNNVVTLTGTKGTTSSITLPVYNGGVTT